MRSVVRSITLAGGILAIANAQSASAQIVNQLEFTTAFPFTVGNATVPAGTYTITPDAGDPTILELAGPTTAVFVATESAHSRETPSKDEVVFKRYGTGYVLKSIWVQGSDTGYVTVSAEGERRAAKRGDAASEERIAARKKADAAK
jgi:hypothetical protein